MRRKIKTLKFPRIFHIPTSQRIDRDDRIAEDYWKHINGKRVVITSKMDGGNTCIDKDGNVFARSHAMGTIDHSFDHLKARAPSFLQILIDENISIYGENLYNVHTVIYDELPDWFLLFAVRRNDTWLSWDEVVRIASLIGFQTVPVLKIGKFNDRKQFEDMIYNIAKNNTCFGEKYMEGVVVWLYDEFQHDEFNNSVFKWVNSDFAIRGEHWSKSKRIIQRRSDR